jgi:hypothetical protein
MTATQASLPGCSATPTGNRAALEQDVRTHLTLMVLAFDCWAIETLGHSQNSLDANIEAWRKEGCPPHPMVTRVVARMREYVSRLGNTTTPSWLPQSIANLLKVA